MLERCLSRSHGIYVEPPLAERVAEEDSGVLFIVDDQNGSVHFG
jgi:hypothetical protein